MDNKKVLLKDIVIGTLIAIIPSLFIYIDFFAISATLLTFVLLFIYWKKIKLSTKLNKRLLLIGRYLSISGLMFSILSLPLVAFGGDHPIFIARFILWGVYNFLIYLLFIRWQKGYSIKQVKVLLILITLMLIYSFISTYVRIAIEYYTGIDILSYFVK